MRPLALAIGPILRGLRERGGNIPRIPARPRAHVVTTNDLQLIVV
jgi:hypothetical protein